MPACQPVVHPAPYIQLYGSGDHNVTRDTYRQITVAWSWSSPEPHGTSVTLSIRLRLTPWNESWHRARRHQVVGFIQSPSTRSYPSVTLPMGVCSRAACAAVWLVALLCAQLLQACMIGAGRHGLCTAASRCYQQRQGPPDCPRIDRIPRAKRSDVSIEARHLARNAIKIVRRQDWS